MTTLVDSGTLQALEPVVRTMAAALLWGTWRFLNNTAETGEGFDFPRFASMLLVSAGVGAGFAAAGDPLSQATFAAEVSAYMPLVGVLDNFFSHQLRGVNLGRYDLDRLYNGSKFVQESVEDAELVDDIDDYLFTGEVPEWNGEKQMAFLTLLTRLQSFSRSSETPVPSDAELEQKGTSGDESGGSDESEPQGPAPETFAGGN